MRQQMQHPKDQLVLTPHRGPKPEFDGRVQQLVKETEDHVKQQISRSPTQLDKQMKQGLRFAAGVAGSFLSPRQKLQERIEKNQEFFCFGERGQR